MSRSPRSRALAPLALAAALLVGDVAPVRAQASDPADPGVLVAVDGSEALAGALELLGPELRDVPVQGAAVARAREQLVAVEAMIFDARDRRGRAIADLARLGEERALLRSTIATERIRRQRAGADIARVRGELAELAVASYVGGGAVGDPLPIDDRATTASGRRRVLVAAVDAELRERLADAEATLAEATNQVVLARDLLDGVVEEIAAATAVRAEAEEVLAREEPRLPDLQQAVADAALLSTITGSDLPLIAYDAYRRGARSVAGCTLPWTVLAGIGRVESRHGSFGGSSLRPDGSTTRRIIGIALDGRPGVALILDTDGGTLDGDGVYDRAVGPMQFIPGTWRSVGRDGNGNGRADPHNLYDAAASAAFYLCRTSGSLQGGATLDRALLSYNNSRAYVSEVLAHRRAYDRLGLAG